VARRLFWLFAPCACPPLPPLPQLGQGLTEPRVRALVEPPPRADYTRLNQAALMPLLHAREDQVLGMESNGEAMCSRAVGKLFVVPAGASTAGFGLPNGHKSQIISG
jgi:hypothetical protein